MMTPILCGVAVATFAEYEGPRHLLLVRESLQVQRIARFLWISVLILAAFLAAVLVWAVDQTVWFASLICNLCLFSGLALCALLIGIPFLSWLAPSVLLLCAMTFGYDSHGEDPDWYMWASFLSEEVSVGRSAFSICMLAIPVFLYVVGVSFRTPSIRTFPSDRQR